MATSVGNPASEPQSISRDDVFELLSSHRRRYALHACKQVEESIEISDLAEQVAAWEYGKPRPEVTSDERHRVYTSMQQTHLPAMDDAGVIDYDNGTVTPTEQAEELEVYIDVVPENSIPWAEYYLGISAVAAALVAAVWFGVFPASIPDIAWAAGIAVLFTSSAAYHVYENRRMRLGASDAPPDVER